MALTPKADELLFLPLGGTGEIGMNLYLYGHDDRWLMVDLGITFADERFPGIDVMMPDITFIAEQRDKLSALVISHAHEDHLGAVAHLWPRLQCPVYATPFCAAVLRRKLREAGLEKLVPLNEVQLGGRFQTGPFDIELVNVTHSVPEPSALMIRTPVGSLLHSGDWKLDPEPLVGSAFDSKRLQELGDEGILALIGDSTNATEEGSSGSESDVRAELAKVIRGLSGRVAVTCFATNVARVETVAQIAEETGRRLALVGRSMHNIVSAAQEVGYLQDLPELVDAREVGYLPRDEVMLLITGSQGESRSALARIARDEHPDVVLEEGDTVIFSSSEIPGNEKAIHTMQNRLARLGIDIITADDHAIHVSGHPAREELERMYQWTRPQIAIPVHGESRHLLAHARLAEACQVKEVVVPEDGAVVRLAPQPAGIVDHVQAGRLALDGTRLIPADSVAIRERRKMILGGTAVLTLVLDNQGYAVGAPQLSLQGVTDSEEEAAEVKAETVNAVESAVEALRPGDRRHDGIVKETARIAVRRSLNRLLGKKPIAEVHLVRVD